MKFVSNSEEMTIGFGAELGGKARPNDIYCLYGDIGAGKTTFAKGFAKGLGVPDDVVSPTFSIVNAYEGRLPLYHFDAYRIIDVSEMYETGFEDMFYSGGVCLIEWAGLIEELIPDVAVKIVIEKSDGSQDMRIITVSGGGV